MSFGRIIVHTYQPEEKAKWLAFEKKVQCILEREYLRQGCDKARAIMVASTELSILVQKNPSQRDKISFHADIAAKRFLED